MPHPLSAKDLKVDPKNTECLIKLGHKIKARDNEGRGSQGSWSPETMPLKWEPQKRPHPCTLPSPDRMRLPWDLSWLHDHGHSGRKRGWP